MSYIGPEYYTDKIEKVSKSGNKQTEVCCYNLKGGGYLVMETEYETVQKEWGEDRKVVRVDAYACDKEPDLTTKDEQLQKLADYARSLNL